ncbi:MAG: aldose 1-epimerase family protein [Planctomycetales bacterium]
MAVWTIIDAEQQESVSRFSVQGSEVCAAAAESRIEYKILRGGVREGVGQLIVDNGVMRVVVLPQRGMGLWKAWSGDTQLGWNSPVQGPVHPQWVPILDPGGLGWLEGFDELLVRCGLLSNGAPEFDGDGRLLYPLHGRIANLPAHKLVVSIDEQSGTITVQGAVDETRFHFQKLRLVSTITMRPDERTIEITDEVSNLSGNGGEMQLLYHVNFGPSLHAPGSELVVPVKEMAPRDGIAAGDLDNWNTYGPAEADCPEQVFYFDLHSDRQGNTRTLLKGANGNQGVSLGFNVNELPCFAQWKNTAPEYDGYVTGLEPATNFPNQRSYEAQQDRVVELAAGQTKSFHLALQYHPDADSLQAAEGEVRALTDGKEPLIHTAPRSGWTPSEDKN